MSTKLNDSNNDRIISFDWLFGKNFSPEEEERRRREEKIRDLLPDEEEDELLGKAYDGRLVKRLLTYIKPYGVKITLAVILMIVSSLMAVAGPWLIGLAIDEGIRTGNMVAMRQWTLIFIVTAIAEWITNRSRIMIMAFVGTKVVADIRSHLFRHLHNLSLNFHNNYSVGRLMSRLISDVGIMQDFVTWSITGLARSSFLLMGIVVAMLVLNWQLALVTFAVLPLVFLLTNY